MGEIDTNYELKDPNVPNNYHLLTHNNKIIINKVIDCLVEGQRRKENDRNKIC